MIALDAPFKAPTLVKKCLTAFAVLAGTLATLLVIAHAIQNFQRTIDVYAERIADRDVSNGPTEDYVAFYAAGALVAEGRGNELYDIDSIAAKEQEVKGRPVGGTGRLGFYNPPFVAAFWAALSRLSLDAALAVWATLVAAVLALTAVAGPRILGLRGWHWLLASAALLLSQAAIGVLLQAQMTVFVIAAYVLFVGLMQRGNRKWAGVALALALVKPHFVLLPLLYLVWRREWLALKAFASVAVPLVLFSLLIAGHSALWEYPLLLIESTSWDGQNGIDRASMFGWYGYVDRHDAGYAVLVFLASATLALAAIGTARHSPPGGVACLLVASLLVNAHLYGQDMALLVVACWFIVIIRPNWWPVLICGAFALLTGKDVQTFALLGLLVLLVLSPKTDVNARVNLPPQLAAQNRLLRH